jgi:two-component system nitrate/nitrite response regulator NarL
MRWSLKIQHNLSNGSYIQLKSVFGQLMPVSIVIAEESFLGADLLATALKRCQNYFNVMAQVSSLSEATKSLAEHKPQIALVSIRLRDGQTSGYKLISYAREHFPSTSTVALLHDSQQEHVLEAFQCGARGVISRNQAFRVLVKCIRKVHEGEIWASPDQIGFVFESLKRNSDWAAAHPPQKDLGELTPRERDVAALVMEGLRNAEIAVRLNVSEHTVRNYIMRIYDKLGVSNRVQLTRQCTGALRAHTVG